MGSRDDGGFARLRDGGSFDAPPGRPRSGSRVVALTLLTVLLAALAAYLVT